MPQKLGSRQLVQRFAQAAGADLQALNSHNQATREFVADLSARVDRAEQGAYDVYADQHVTLHDLLLRVKSLEHIGMRGVFGRLRWLLTGR